MTALLLTRLHASLERAGLGELAGRVFGPGLIALAIKVATAGLSYVMFVVLARLMSHADYGRFAFAFNLAMALSSVACLGATTAILRFWPQYKVQKQEALARGALKAGAWMTLLASAAAGLLLAALAPAISRLSSDIGATPIAVAGLLLAGFALSEYVSSALRANGITFWALAPRDVFWRGGVPLVTGLAAWLQGGLSATQAIWLAALLLAAIVAAQTVYAARVIPLSGPSQRDWPVWWRAALPMWGAAVLYALVQQFDVVIAGIYLPAAETGAYFAAQKTAGLLGLLLIAGNLVAAPLISSHYHAGDMPGLRRLCAALAAGIAIPTFIGFLLMVAAGKLLLGLFNPHFAAAYPVLLVLSAAAAFDAIAGPTGYFMQMSGSEKTYLKIMAIIYTCTFVAQIVLTPRFGALGTAIPTALAVIAWNVWAVLVLRRRTGIDPSFIGTLQYFAGSIYKARRT